MIHRTVPLLSCIYDLQIRRSEDELNKILQNHLEQFGYNFKKASLTLRKFTSRVSTGKASFLVDKSRSVSPCEEADKWVGRS